MILANIPGQSQPRPFVNFKVFLLVEVNDVSLCYPLSHRSDLSAAFLIGIDHHVDMQTGEVFIEAENEAAGAVLNLFWGKQDEAMRCGSARQIRAFFSLSAPNGKQHDEERGYFTGHCPGHHRSRFCRDQCPLYSRGARCKEAGACQFARHYPTKEMNVLGYFSCIRRKSLSRKRCLAPGLCCREG